MGGLHFQGCLLLNRDMGALIVRNFKMYQSNYSITTQVISDLLLVRIMRMKVVSLPYTPLEGVIHLQAQQIFGCLEIERFL